MDNYEIDRNFYFHHVGDEDEQRSLHTGYDDSETQDVGGMFVDQPENAENNGSSACANQTRKTRGKNIIRWGVNGKEKMKWGKKGSPLGPKKKCTEFSKFIGSLAADCGNYPINVTDWRHFQRNQHRPVWERVKDTIDWEHEDTGAKKDAIKKVVFERLADRWKHHKSILKKEHWLPNQKSDRRFQCPDSSMDATRWLEFVNHLDDEDTQIKAAINVSNRSHRTLHHSTGSRTFASIVHEWQTKNGVEQEPDRWEIFKLTHRKKDSKDEYVDAASTNAVVEFQAAEEARIAANVVITPEVREEIYAEVLGPEKRNRVRGLGAGVRWADVPHINTEKKGVSKNVQALEARIEEQRLETEQLRLEAEKIRAEAAERDKNHQSEIEKFMREQRQLMEENQRMMHQQMSEMYRQLGSRAFDTTPSQALVEQQIREYSAEIPSI